MHLHRKVYQLKETSYKDLIRKQFLIQKQNLKIFLTSIRLRERQHYEKDFESIFLLFKKRFLLKLKTLDFVLFFSEKTTIVVRFVLTSTLMSQR
jgi:hypothetical protein